MILSIKKIFLAALLISVNTSTNAQLVSVPVSGFNNDIVANGVGNNSIPGTTYPSIGMDGAMYTFIDNTYKYAASSSLPTCFMPINNTAASMRTPGLNYIFQSYSGFNSLTIDNDNTAYLSSPFSKTGTLILTNPASYSKLFVLYESVMYISPMTVNVLVTFTDNSTQAFNGNSCVNWFTATLPAFNNVGRTQPTGALQCGGTPNFFPNLFELQLTLNASNYNKQVQSITFTLPTVYTTGTTADKVNYFHAMAVGGQVAPLSTANEKEAATIVNIFPNPTSNEITITSNIVTPNTYLRLFDLAGNEMNLIKIEHNQQKISLKSLAEGFYLYQLINENGTVSNGKIALLK